MEKGEAIPILWMTGAYAIMIGAKMFLVEPWATYVGYASVTFFMGATILQDAYAQIHLSGLINFYATVYPKWGRSEFFYKSYESVPLGNNRFRTLIFLGELFKHPVHGKVNRVFIFHCLPWLARVKFQQGKASYLGLTVTHNQTDLPTLYERDAVEDHGAFYPTYEMVTAGGDYPYLAEIVAKGFDACPEIVKEMTQGVKEKVNNI